MRKIGLVLLFFPLCLRAAENEVPLGTRGNTFVYTVGNATSKTVRKPMVFISSAPAWLMFHSTIIAGDSILPGDRRDFQFNFDVANGESGRIGTVKLIVTDSAGTFYSMKSVAMKTVLAENKTLLLTPYPNPANPSTTFRFALTEASRVNLHIYNILGQRVRTLMDETKPAGQWEARWDGQNDRGVPVSSGVYIVQMTATAGNKAQQFKTKITLEK
jgi:hypothetical protein